ncbi:hypothetical protein KR009_012048 [Drosophila setifemur]|nr:hypothetical protein KR009_012048 [Drosophila setifemur]
MRLVNMTEHMDKILKFHNELRHRLALGKDTSLPRAARLVAMLWSNDLAEVAGFNVRMCLPRHDECRNTPNFTRSGQNIIVFNMTRQVEEEEMNQRMPELLSITTQTWWAESANITMENLEQYPCDGKQQNPIRHFAEMAIEGNSHVGCAGSVYLVRNMTQLKLTCNYARSPVCGQPIFRFRPLGCKSRNRKHLSLCSPTELFP